MSSKFCATGYIIEGLLVAYQIGYVSDRCPRKQFQTIFFVFVINENHSEIAKKLISHLIIFQDVAGSFLYKKDKIIGMGLPGSDIQGCPFAFVNIGIFSSKINDALVKYNEWTMF